MNDKVNPDRIDNVHSPAQARPEFSVIITCYFEENSIDEFHKRLSSALESLDRTSEIIFVNDGSTDETWNKLKKIYDNDSRVTAVIDLFRNSGQLAAMTAGIEHARGGHFIFMDSDLQLDPEELPKLVNEFNKGYDIVSGCRKTRHDPLLRIVSSKVANIVVKKVSGHKVTDLGCTFKIYNGKLIRAFNFGPMKKMQTAYVYSKARTYLEVPVTHHPRKYGKSGWTFKNLFAFHMDNLVGISRRPFQLLSFLCIIFSALLFLRLLAAWIVHFKILPEITTGLLLNVILIHLLMTFAVLSLIGEYVIRNFISLQAYPIYVVRKIHKKTDSKQEH